MSGDWKEKLKQLSRESYAVTGTASSLANLKPSHVTGAKDAHKVTIKALYAYGDVSVAQAIAYGATPKDHIAALDNCKTNAEVEAFVQALADNGVDFGALESARRRTLKAAGYDAKPADYDVQNGKVIGKDGDTTSLAQAAARKAANERSLAMSKRPVVVVHNNSVALAKVKQKPLTKQQVEIAAMMVRAQEHERLVKKLAWLKAENAHLERSLTDEQKAEVVARMQNKGKVDIH